MLRSDALHLKPAMKIFGNVDSITLDVISKAQNDMEPYDIMSMVFLLYDVPDTALQRLTIYQRIYKDIGGNTEDLLEWARHAQKRPTWQHEFLEALVICQLFNVVRRLGFDVSDVKKKFKQDQMIFINPMKKLLYRLCEHMESSNLTILKKTILTYKIDVSEYEHCELILLKLLCNKFISIEQHDYGFVYNMQKLTKIISNLVGLEGIADEINDLEHASKNVQKEAGGAVASTSAGIDRMGKLKIDDTKDLFLQSITNDDILKVLELTHENIKSDKTAPNKNVYEIKNPAHVGVCYIINQEEFDPPNNSIEKSLTYEPLEKRVGSTKDKDALEKTMTALNFDVITRDNQDHETMIQGIKEILLYRVNRTHSIFMLCILSHGTRGYVYAADSVQVKIEYLESLLESDGAKYLQGMPKVVILQACQNDKDNVFPNLVADAPSYYIKKSDILRFTATAPGYEAYRLEDFGSIFIQILCFVLEKRGSEDHLVDLFTKVINAVSKICTKLRNDQLPYQNSTLRKKLYLKKNN